MKRLPSSRWNPSQEKKNRRTSEAWDRCSTPEFLRRMDSDKDAAAALERTCRIRMILMPSDPGLLNASAVKGLKDAMDSAGEIRKKNAPDHGERRGLHAPILPNSALSSKFVQHRARELTKRQVHIRFAPGLCISKIEFEIVHNNNCILELRFY